MSITRSNLCSKRIWASCLYRIHMWRHRGSFLLVSYVVGGDKAKQQHIGMRRCSFVRTKYLYHRSMMVPPFIEMWCLCLGSDMWWHLHKNKKHHLTCLNEWHQKLGFQTLTLFNFGCFLHLCMPSPCVHHISIYYMFKIWFKLFNLIKQKEHTKSMVWNQDLLLLHYHHHAIW